jgi:hypothetical protein
VAVLTGSAEGREGAIRVTVGAAGQVERLDLDERVHELSGPRLAEEIMSVMRRAQPLCRAGWPARCGRRLARTPRPAVR